MYQRTGFWVALAPIVIAACGGTSIGGDPRGQAGTAGSSGSTATGGPASSGSGKARPTTPSLGTGGASPSYGTAGVTGDPYPAVGGAYPNGGYAGAAYYGGDAGAPIYPYPYGGDAGAAPYPYGGAAGAPSYEFGGTGGTTPIGPQPQCDSPITSKLAPWQDRLNDDGSVAAVLARARSSLVGAWHGSVTSPWVPPYQISATFRADGGYSARCDQNSDFDGGSGCCRAFYYGSDLDSALKRWSLSAVNEDGSVAGDLDVAFCDPNGGCGLPAWQGQLRNLEYDATSNRLRLEFWTDAGYGPLQLDLERD